MGHSRQQRSKGTLSTTSDQGENRLYANLMYLFQVVGRTSR
jgi:hypothetical protein